MADTPNDPTPDTPDPEIPVHTDDDDPRTEDERVTEDET